MPPELVQWINPAILVLLCMVPTSAETLTGLPRVVDGDTVEIDDERVRLEGIDAPESKQTCKRGGQRYPCGEEATSALRMRIGEASIRCEGNLRDKYKRLIAVCYLDSMDLNGWMVRQGHALAYRKYSKQYVAAEDAARRAKRALWQGQFIKPWLWRQGERLP